jgi:hypothetical protein
LYGLQDRRVFSCNGTPSTMTVRSKPSPALTSEGIGPRRMDKLRRVREHPIDQSLELVVFDGSAEQVLWLVPGDPWALIPARGQTSYWVPSEQAKSLPMVEVCAQPPPPPAGPDPSMGDSGGMGEPEGSPGPTGDSAGEDPMDSGPESPPPGMPDSAP